MAVLFAYPNLTTKNKIDFVQDAFLETSYAQEQNFGSNIHGTGPRMAAYTPSRAPPCTPGVN